MKRTLYSMMVLTFVVSFGGLVLVVTRLSPYDDAAWLSLTLFVLSSFMAGTSLFTLIGSVIRTIFLREEMYMVHFLISLRQGILFSICVLGYLALSILGVASIWNVLLYFISIFFVELYFLNNDKRIS